VSHRATPSFWELYRALPDVVQRLANHCFKMLREDPRHPSLHLKQVGHFWSVRVGTHYRALAVEHQSDLVWFWTGSHAEYDRLVGRA